ncbi:pyridoxal phosphate-dependent aminotransferase [Salipiger sp. P9]|uniref:pyridoxal phosphate-dependent aminotransferase n=1 Tax=Salipiger pentaromativorans TaxID=2943193 RepID=UPI002157E64C|nr:pyridoxal phosphate-dependent aminotransferase [Salipiger pentaromativorans]MCR8550250.1 pyridoxal phosphate-dependent aminotransferase [Salipiger pentaromativorans]
MPRLSNRISTLNDGGSDGWEVFLKARRMAEAGEPVIELTIGEHDIRTDPEILRAMAEAAAGGHTGYSAIPGTDALRDAVAARIAARSGVATSRANVLITPGGQAALFAAHMAACDPGDTALFIDPHYATYPGTLRAVGARPRAIATDPARAFLPDPQRIAEAAQETGAASLLINTPNNPSGAIYPRATLEGIAQAAEAADLWLISDEVYDTQIWEGAHLSPRALPGMAARTLVIGSMSKSHAMTGSRIGWVAGPEEAIARLYDLSVNTTYGVPGYIQDAALFALRQGTPLETRIAEPFRRRRALAQQILAQQNSVGLVPSGGAMYLFLDIRATGLSGESFAHALLDERRIAVMPGESFGASAAGFVRVAMTVPDADFAAALETLCAFAETRAVAA